VALISQKMIIIIVTAVETSNLTTKLLLAYITFTRRNAYLTRMKGYSNLPYTGAALLATALT
jgi:hypothetical protein